MTAGSMNTHVTKRRPMIDMEEFERRLRQSSGNQTDDGPLAELTRVISGQKEPVQSVAEPQSQSSTEARQEATSSPDAKNTEAEEPDALQSLDDDKIACRDSGAVNEKIASRRSLYITIVAAIIVAGIIGVVASVGYRKSASPPPEIALLSENGPAEPQQTNRSDVPTPDASILGGAPQPSPTAVNNVAQPVDPSRPRETVPAAEVAASTEQIETQEQPPSQTASIEPEKMNTASVEQHATISSDMPPRAKPKRPESAVRAQPTSVTSTTEKRGWVNFGTFTNGNWVEKQFEISGAPMRPPRPGDTLTATIPVNVRRGPIEGTKDFRWQNQPVACDPTNVGEKFTVMKSVEIVPGYYWAEIKNSVQCTK
jgi:hypothetical protein